MKKDNGLIQITNCTEKFKTETWEIAKAKGWTICKYAKMAIREKNEQEKAKKEQSGEV